MPPFKPPKWILETEKEGDRVAESLLNAVQRFVDGKDQSQERWVSVLRSVLLRPLQDAVETHRELLQEKGFANGGAKAAPAAQAVARAIEEAVTEALQATDDLRRTVLEAEDDRQDEEPITAAIGLKRILSIAHQKLTATSIIRSALDKFERKITTSPGAIEGTGFTGRRRWKSDPNGRHGVINGQVVGPDQDWRLPERRIGNKVLSAKSVPYPRFDPSDAQEWSGSTASVEYEFRLENGTVEWR